MERGLVEDENLVVGHYREFTFREQMKLQYFIS